MRDDRDAMAYDARGERDVRDAGSFVAHASRGMKGSLAI